MREHPMANQMRNMIMMNAKVSRDLLLSWADEIDNLVSQTVDAKGLLVGMNACTDKLENSNTALRNQLAEAQKYKQAVENDMTLIGDGRNWGDPNEMLNRIMCWHTHAALDPSVSDEARKLRDTYKDQLAEMTKEVDLFPKFRDGPPALSGSFGYHPTEKGRGLVEYCQTEEVAKGDDEQTIYFGDHGGPPRKHRYMRVSECYSTREAALASSEQAEKGVGDG